MSSVQYTEQHVHATRWVHLEVPHTAFFHLAIAVRAGSKYDPLGQEGLAHLAEHCLFLGTERFPLESDLETYLDEVGGQFNAYTSENTLMLYAQVPVQYAERALVALTDLLVHPQFPADTFERERNVVLQELTNYEAQPTYPVQCLQQERYWQGTRLAHPVLGTRESLLTIGVEDLRRHWTARAVPANIAISTLAPAGGGLTDHLAAQFQEHLAPLAGRTTSPDTFSTPQPVYGVHRLAHPTAHLLSVHSPGVAIGDPQETALDALACYLGNGLNSELFRELRRERGLVYGVSCHHNQEPEAGAFCVNLQTGNLEQLDEAYQVVQDVFTRVRYEGLSEQQLLVVQRKLVSEALSWAERYAKLPMLTARLAVEGQPLSYLQVLNHVQDIETLTLAELQAAAQSALDPDHLCWVLATQH